MLALPLALSLRRSYRSLIQTAMKPERYHPNIFLLAAVSRASFHHLVPTPSGGVSFSEHAFSTNVVESSSTDSSMAGSETKSIVPISSSLTSSKNTNTGDANDEHTKEKILACWTGTIDTQSLVNSLASTNVGFTVAQSEAVVTVIQDLINEKSNVEIIDKQQIETDAQMLKARCHEIRLELQIQASKIATARKAIHEQCTTEIQATIEKLRDAADMLQTDARMRLSLFKTENREELSKIDSTLHHNNSQLALQMSEIKTFAESVKVRLMLLFTSFFIFALFVIVIEKNVRRTGEKKDKESKSGHNTMEIDDFKPKETV